MSNMPNGASLNNLRFLIAGYGLPAEIGITTLFANGVRPENIQLLTHEKDQRNAGLCNLVDLRQINASASSPTAEATMDWVKRFSPDIILSLHYRLRIPPMILDLAKLCSINLHPSLLPKYRGTNSVAWTLINGEMETGYTFHFMAENFDTGRIILQERIPILPTDTAFSLFHRQIISGMSHLEDAINSALANPEGTRQQGEASYFPRKLPHGGIIDPEWDLQKIDRFIRAMYFPPFDPAVAVFNGQRHSVSSLEEYLQLAGQG